MRRTWIVAAVYDRREGGDGHRPPLQGPLCPASCGFTLLELLVVVALIGGLSLVLFLGLEGSGKPAALQSAQATVSSLVTAARLKAAASGRHCRVLVANDPADPERYLRFLALQQARHPGASATEWDTVQTAALPAGTFIVPATITSPVGLVSDASRWRRSTEPGEELASGAFLNQTIVHALEGDVTARQWTGVCYTPQGTLARLGTVGGPPRGLIVITTGVRRPPGSYATGASPVLLTPDLVRGLMLSAYGVPAWLNDQNAL
jgi:prepilin-type N-terminal cleavage/methylation domain-containing protein